MLAAITQTWLPLFTYQQLLTVWWVPKQLLQKAAFDTFTFAGGWGGGAQKSFSRKIPNGEIPYLRALPVVLVNPTSYFETTLELSIRNPWATFLVESYGD